MLPTTILSSILFFMAVSASPVPNQPRKVVTLREGKPRMSFAERQEATGASLSDLIQTDRKVVAAKYARNNALAKAAKAKGVNISKRQNTIGLTDYNTGGVDELYYGTLDIGTPAQQITFDFDTGSSDLWTPVQGSNGYNDGTQFNPNESSSYQNTGQSFNDQYGSGSCSGTVGIETVSFGGLTATNQYFGAVTQVSTDFDNNPATGLCGLAYQSISSIGQPPLPLNLYNEGQISNPEFGFRLTRDTSDGAELTMGGPASDYAGASFQQTPVTSQTYYEVQTNGITVNGQTVSSGFPAAIDTGTTLLYVPTAAAQAFYAAIPGSSANGDGSYNYPCDFSGSVGLNFANIGNLNFNTADLNIGSVGGGMCTGAVQGADEQDANGNDFAIVGDTFIKSYYTIFNFGDNYVAFTPANGNT